MTAPHPEGLGAIKVMQNCLRDAKVDLSLIDTVNMHGTSTPLGDVAESKALYDVFGDHLYSMNINSTKSMTGHLLGAAGAVEAISSILSINSGSFLQLLTIKQTTSLLIIKSISLLISLKKEMLNML